MARCPTLSRSSEISESVIQMADGRWQIPRCPSLPDVSARSMKPFTAVQYSRIPTPLVRKRLIIRHNKSCFELHQTLPINSPVHQSTFFLKIIFLAQSSEPKPTPSPTPQSLQPQCRSLSSSTRTRAYVSYRPCPFTVFTTNTMNSRGPTLPKSPSSSRNSVCPTRRSYSISRT